MNAKPEPLRACRWTFADDCDAHDGFTDDSRWNGWLNVWVTPEVHARVMAWALDDATHDEENAAQWRAMEASVRPGSEHLGPLFCYGWGYCAEEVTA